MNKKRLVITSMITISLVVILLFSSTYAIFTSQEVDENLNVYTTGNLDVTYTLSEDNITLTDNKAIRVENSGDIRPFRITVTNTGNVSYLFDVVLEDTTASEKIDYRYIMVQVGRMDPKTLKDCQNNVIQESVIVPAGEQAVIDVRVWVSDKIQNSEIGKSFFAKLKIEGLAVYNQNAEIDNSMLVASGKYASNYCNDIGVTKLGDCMLLSENFDATVSEAKDFISRKKADFTHTAPMIEYTEKKEQLVTNEKGVISSNNKIYVGTSYTFDVSKGIYTLLNAQLMEMTEAISTATKKYYTCNNQEVSGNCSMMYVIYDATKTTSGGMTTYQATEVGKYTYSMSKAIDSEKGLYALDDDYGTSYYYRGSIGNNYVSFAGFVWRIVRMNGDGSIRMIYSGTSTSDTGKATAIEVATYNSERYDSAMVGYQYGLSKTLQHTTNDNLIYSGIHSTTKYYFGTSYTFNDSTKKLSLSGELIQGTLAEVWKENGSSDYKYTCFSTSSVGTCSTLIEIKSYVSESEVAVNYHSYLSKSYEATNTDEFDSTIKVKIDNWYKNNIEDKGYSGYLADSLFCNDRSVSSGDGFSLNQTTLYGSYVRNVANKNPSLKCLRQNDQFTVTSNQTIGNGELTYPIGLLTLDEVVLAGGMDHSYNQGFYLYTGQNYWLISPFSFDSMTTIASVGGVTADGGITSFETWSTSMTGIRPVINLKSNVEIIGGNGTQATPFLIKTT